MRVSTAVLGLVFLLGQQAAPVTPAQPSFAEWLAALRAEALTRGIGEATLDRALEGLEPVPVVIERDPTYRRASSALMSSSWSAGHRGAADWEPLPGRGA